MPSLRAAVDIIKPGSESPNNMNDSNKPEGTCLVAETEVIDLAVCAARRICLFRASDKQAHAGDTFITKSQINSFFNNKASGAAPFPPLPTAVPFSVALQKIPPSTSDKQR